MIINELNEKLRESYEQFPLFGIILYTSQHPHVIKMLKDEDYLAALNDITGEQIAIFWTGLFPGHYKSPPSEPGQLSIMFMIWQEPNQNKELLSWFDLETSKDLPLLVLFGIDFEKNDLYCQKYSIKAESPQNTYNLLQEALSAASTQIQKNSSLDRIAVFKKAQWEIKKIQARKGFSQLFQLTSLLRGVGGI